MGKNLPITARVNKGLFNQKAGVKEPLLNVGPCWCIWKQRNERRGYEVSR